MSVAAVAQIQSPALELPHAVGTTTNEKNNCYLGNGSQLHLSVWQTLLTMPD